MRNQINREELYEKVWQTPLTRLAGEMGLSDVGLRNICKKLDIPLPGKGYHLRHNKVKVPLPERATSRVVVIRKPPQAVTKHILDQIPEIQFERHPENKILVSETASTHRLAKLTERILHTQKPDRFGRVSCRGANALDVSVSFGLIERATRIMSALIIALAKRGYTTAIDPVGKTFVTIDGEPIDIRLEERTLQRIHEPTPEETEEARIYHWQPRAYDYFPTGKLSLTLTTSYRSTRRITDGRRGQIEDRINDFMVELLAAREELKTKEKVSTDERKGPFF
jgi:hypothetical protein